MTLSDIRWEIFIGGLGLFLFGIVIMGEGLKSMAGDKLREWIDKYTSKPWQGLMIGTIITAAIQSSGATTAICIGFIRAGLMTFEQSAGIIIGANIGTTITAFLIGLNISSISYYLILIGAGIMLFMHKKNYQDIGKVVLGFGLLFYSLDAMSGALSELKNVPMFIEFARMCADNPFIGLIGGVILTICMQSSSASIGIIQLFYVTGAISFIGVIPFLYGANIGSTITAILASLGGVVAAKRSSVFHLIFNMIGTIIGMVLLVPLFKLMMYLSSTYNINPMMQIAITHILFNIITTILVFPFVKYLCAFIKKIVPGEEPKRLEINLEELNPSNFPVVSTALIAAYSAIKEMRKVVVTNLENTQNYLNSKDASDDDFNHIQETEKIINKIDHSVTHFITNLPIEQSSQDTIHMSTLYLEVTKNLERIGDLSVNIAEFAMMVHNDNDGSFSQKAYEEMASMFTLLYKMLDDAFEFLDTKDIKYYERIITNEANLDTLEYQSRKNHFKRMVKKECTGAVASSIYADVLGTLERMGDHCYNIVKHGFEAYS